MKYSQSFILAALTKSLFSLVLESIQSFRGLILINLSLLHRQPLNYHSIVVTRLHTDTTEWSEGWESRKLKTEVSWDALPLAKWSFWISNNQSLIGWVCQNPTDFSPSLGNQAKSIQMHAINKWKISNCAQSHRGEAREFSPQQALWWKELESSRMFWNTEIPIHSSLTLFPVHVSKQIRHP